MIKYELRKTANLRRKDLIYPELSYEIVGVVYDVYDQLGYGLKEKIYQGAVAVGLQEKGLQFQKELYAPFIYKGQNVGKNYLDFLVEGKIVLELKRGERIVKAHIEQVHQYLVSKNLQLGILAYFSTRGVIFKRIINVSS